MTHAEEATYGPNHQVTYEVFMAHVLDLHDRFPTIQWMNQHRNVTGVEFSGMFEGGFPFNLEYILETAEDDPRINMSISLQTIHTGTWFIDWRDISFMTYRTHRAFPDSQDFIITAEKIPNSPAELDLRLWSTVWPSEGITLADVDQTFERIFTLAPRVQEHLFPIMTELSPRRLQ